MGYETLTPTFEKLAEEFPTADLLAQVEQILNKRLSKFEEPTVISRRIERVLREVQTAKHSAIFID